MKIAFSGTHGTGKTTKVFEKALTLKKEHKQKVINTLSEVAVACPYHINLEGDENSQMWIMTSQIKYELEQGLNADILVCDRTVCDCLAYTLYMGLNTLAESLLPTVKFWLTTYDKIYLAYPKDNEYCYDNGIRSHTDEKFRLGVHAQLVYLYDMFGVKVGRV